MESLYILRTVRGHGRMISRIRPFILVVRPRLIHLLTLISVWVSDIDTGFIGLVIDDQNRKICSRASPNPSEFIH